MSERIPAATTKVEVQYLDYKSSKAPQVRAVVQGDTLRLVVEQDESAICFWLPFSFYRPCTNAARVRVFGPLEMRSPAAVQPFSNYRPIVVQ